MLRHVLCESWDNESQALQPAFPMATCGTAAQPSWVCFLDLPFGAAVRSRRWPPESHNKQPATVSDAHPFMLEARTLHAGLFVDFCGLPSWVLFSLCHKLKVDGIVVPPLYFLTLSPFISQILFSLVCFYFLFIYFDF